MAVVLTIIGVLVFFAVIVLASSIRVLREYERGVIFRLGRLIGQKGPGLIFLIPIIDKMVRVDLRTVTLNIPPQEVITRDNVPASVNAVCYFQRGRTRTTRSCRSRTTCWRRRRSPRRLCAPCSAAPSWTRCSRSATA